MVESGLEKPILKFHMPLQRYLLSCQANSAFLGRFLHWAAATLKGHMEFHNRPLFTIIFKPKMVKLVCRTSLPLSKRVWNICILPIHNCKIKLKQCFRFPLFLVFECNKTVELTIQKKMLFQINLPVHSGILSMYLSGEEVIYG